MQLYQIASVFGRRSFSGSTSVTPTEISNQPRRPGSRMSARFNVTRSSSDSQTYPPFAVQVDSETSRDRDQLHWSRSFAFAIGLVGRTTNANFESRVVQYFRTPRAGGRSSASAGICRSLVPAVNTVHWFSVREHRKCVQTRWASQSGSAKQVDST